ncbi:MAG TPA: ABC transporter ATP-binding protein [Burkholderiaceae bacterium]|nr:ABC transporter ATP-binding protein [Burkholderiaceae bacterium]
MTDQPSSTTDPVLRLDGVALGYGDVTVLNGIDMAIAPGRVVAVMGGSGSGKTTLLRAATGQIHPLAGTIQAFGHDVASADTNGLQKLRQRMGVLFQQGALFTDLNVFENVAFPLREHRHLPEDDVTRQVLDKLDAVGLRAAAHLNISEISGGMARRVALARAIVLEPELILYDEPFAGLDPISLGITAQLIRGMTDRLHCASVLITHDVAESFAIADHVYMVGQGKLIASGTPDELSASTDPYVRQFLDAKPDGPIAFNYPETSRFQQWLSSRLKGRP